MQKISIEFSGVQLVAVLNTSETAKSIADSLPLEGEVSIWGDEIYFSIPVFLDESPEAVEDVEPGDLAYWPAGHAFCIFFGPTPVSKESEPRAVSPVNPIGKLIGNIEVLKKLGSSIYVRIEISK